MEYDYNELLGLIKRYFGAQERFANYLGISAPSLTGRISSPLLRAFFFYTDFCKCMGFY